MINIDLRRYGTDKEYERYVNGCLSGADVDETPIIIPMKGEKEIMSDFEKSMVEITKRANDFIHKKRAEGITVIPAREFFEAIGIIDFFFGNDVGIDISNFKGE